MLAHTVSPRGAADCAGGCHKVEGVMAKGISLHVGLNRIDPKHYGTEGLLAGCVNDARAMESIARTRGFQATVMIDREATSKRVVDWLTSTARAAKAGDT